MPAGGGKKRGEARGGVRVGEARGVDVGDAIALGVSATDAGVPGNVDAEAVGRGKPGAFPDEDGGELGTQELADFISAGHSAVTDENERGQCPGVKLREESLKSGDGVVFERRGGEAVGQDQSKVEGLRRGAKLLERFGGSRSEAPPEVRPPEIGFAVGGAAFDAKAFHTELGFQLLVQAGGVERGADGVSRLGVGQVEGQHFVSGKRVAGASESDARGGVTPKKRPGILYNDGSVQVIGILRFAQNGTSCYGASSMRADWSWRGSSRPPMRRPAESTSSMRASQSSNSGAGRRPSTSRRYSASWNDVLW